ncbi:MAG: putative NH(3)-dependent NAD(+) synthetase [Methanomassiliicoccales archaeon PtaU1.Bin124]|nr:MAG: putative NH(3)-dependent NAD(+) synthetase [Methanomassiliicoccales archaeon PtaU1.Bin124]
MRPQLKPDAELVLIEFIRQKVEESHGNGVVVGLSGGVDSALVTKLCVMAVGADKVSNLFLPSSTTPQVDRDHVKELAKQLGTKLTEIDITPLVEAYEKTLPAMARKELKGNVMARVRMTVLYHYAKMNFHLVMGTGNKSELLMGYFTKYGDGGCDYLPIGDLYKTEVWELARKLQLPDFVVDKIPSAGLWAGQTDEAEMGITYNELDQVLLGMEQSLSPEEIVKRTGVKLSLVQMVMVKHLTSVHKRKMPLIPKIGLRTIGLDWRE